VEYLRSRYGSETASLFALCRADPELARPLCSGHPAIGAQVHFALEREFALTADDILERRIRLTTETPDAGASARPRVEALMARYFSHHEDR
jgi:glycerol-3-phosphate dehydrogenase